MGFSIVSNISALRAQRALDSATASHGGALERLSSGLRINHAADDAAGLAVAASLNAKVRIHTQAIRNVNDAVSSLTMAQGALEQLSAINIRQRELATQAANGSYSRQQRNALNGEANALVSEFNRVTASVSFNGISLLDRSIDELQIQAGQGAESSLGVALGDELARVAGDGTFKSTASFATTNNSLYIASGDLNGDGRLDLVTVEYSNLSFSVLLGNGNGTFLARTSFRCTSNPSWVNVADINGDAKADLTISSSSGNYLATFLGNGNGTFSADTSFYSGRTDAGQFVDVNGDGIGDAVCLYSPGGTGSISVLLGNGNATYMARLSFSAGLSPSSFQMGDVNGDERLDIVTNPSGGGGSLFFTGNGDGTFTVAKTLPFDFVWSINDFNTDGIADVVAVEAASVFRPYLGNGDGTFKPLAGYAGGASPRKFLTTDLNEDGRLDLTFLGDGNGLYVALGNGDGTFTMMATMLFGSSRSHAADFNGDGALDLASSGVGAWVALANAREVTTMPYLNINTRAGALAAMQTIDESLARALDELGAVASFQSRLGTTLNTLRTSGDNYASAASRVTDVDVAQESAQLLRSSITQQAATAVLSQANKQPQLLLMLLRDR